MEMNVEKTKVMRISRQPSPVTIMIDQKQLENVECGMINNLIYFLVIIKYSQQQNTDTDKADSFKT